MYVSLCKKNISPVLLLLNIYKLSYFIGYRCLNLTSYHYILVQGWIREINQNFGRASGREGLGESYTWCTGFMWNKVKEFMKLIMWSCQYGYQIMYQIVHNKYQNWLKIQVLLVVYTVSLVHDSYIMKLVETIAKSVCKIINMSLQLCEFILPKEYAMLRHWI
jgi:hypothetical protein